MRPELSSVESLNAMIYGTTPVVLVGLVDILESLTRVHPVRGMSTWAEAVLAISAESPDLVLIDGGTGEDDQLLPNLAHVAVNLASNVLLFSARLDPAFIRAVFSVGVLGLIPRDASRDEVGAAAIYVGRGKSYLHPTLGVRLLDGVAVNEPYQPGLSDRECEIVQLVAGGHTQKEMGSILHISVRTVETHLLHVRQKLDLITRADVVSFAFASGLAPAVGPRRIGLTPVFHEVPGSRR